MSPGDPLVGRQRERAALEVALARLRAGQGGLVLVAGEAGVGKTRLVEEILRVGDAAFVRGDAPDQAPPPTRRSAPAAARRARGADRHALDDCGPLARYSEACSGSAAPAGRRGPSDDVRGARLCVPVDRRGASRRSCSSTTCTGRSATTCELAGPGRPGLEDERLLDRRRLPQRRDRAADTRLRRMRTDLRRAGRLDELALEPLDRRSAPSELAARRLGGPPARPWSARCRTARRGSLLRRGAVRGAAGGDG